MSEELKPCPFCGSRGVELRDNGTFDQPDNGGFEVCCNNCGARTGKAWGTDGKARAIAAWNTRVPQEPGPPR